MKILVLDDYQREAARMDLWARLGDARVEFVHEALATDAQRAARLGGCQAIVAMRERTPFSAALLRALPELRLLVTTGMHNAAIDLAACTAQGITVCGAPGSRDSAGATAELAWALILALFKRIVPNDAATRQGVWQPHTVQSLRGKVLGVAGLGRLGRQVAQVGAAFGMRVIAWSPHLTPERASAAGAEYRDKAAFFAEADVVSLHLVLGEGTRGIIDAHDLAAMRRGAFLVNTSRAGLVAPGALVEALQKGWIAGAGLDVFDTEPLPAEDPIRQCPNVLLSPHVGYVTNDNLQAFYGNAVAAIEAWQAGKPVNVLNP